MKISITIQRNDLYIDVDVYEEELNERDENLSLVADSVDEARKYAEELVARKGLLVVDIQDLVA